MIPTKEDLATFEQLLDKYRYDFCKLAYLIFPFGQAGTELEDFHPHDWQMEEWAKMSRHWQNPYTRDKAYRLVISTGNGSGKTAFGAMTLLMIMYTHQAHIRLTSNTEKQTQTVVWPEYDIWFRRARFAEHFFEKFGTSIKAKNDKLSEKWRIDAVTWSEESPASISGLHNKGRYKAVGYLFEEAAGIPAKVWDYTSGAMTDTDTIKFFFAFANSDDPNSKFEQNMQSPDWNARRIDTRTLPHVSKDQIAVWLRECGGNEDHDEFRVRVRGLPRKTAKDSIIRTEDVEAAFERGKTFDMETVSHFPSILTVDPAWTGGDETAIWHHQGPVSTFLEAFKLDKSRHEDHMLTYNKLCAYEKKLKVDAVFIDQAEGSALKTLANTYGKYHWTLVAFGSKPNDTVEYKDSDYHNMRAQMYFEAGKYLMSGEAILRTEDPYREEDIRKQLTWAKGDRNKQSLKKIVEPKNDIKDRIGSSPDLADGYVLRFAHIVWDRLPEHQHLMHRDEYSEEEAYEMPYDEPDYD